MDGNCRRRHRLRRSRPSCLDAHLQRYVSADGDFEKVQHVGDWNALGAGLDAKVMTPMAEDELIGDDEPILVG